MKHHVRVEVVEGLLQLQAVEAVSRITCLTSAGCLSNDLSAAHTRDSMGKYVGEAPLTIHGKFCMQNQLSI